jgi:hypothetical protein
MGGTDGSDVHNFKQHKINKTGTLTDGETEV